MTRIPFSNATERHADVIKCPIQFEPIEGTKNPGPVHKTKIRRELQESISVFVGECFQSNTQNELQPQSATVKVNNCRGWKSPYSAEIDLHSNLGTTMTITQRRVNREYPPTANFFGKREPGIGERTPIVELHIMRDSQGGISRRTVIRMTDGSSNVSASETYLILTVRNNGPVEARLMPAQHPARILEVGLLVFRDPLLQMTDQESLRALMAQVENFIVCNTPWMVIESPVG